MRIAHLCLAAFYIDNYGYQENILPKKHKQQGNEVLIIASTETYVDNKQLGYVEPQEYFTDDGIPVKRLAYASFLPKKVVRKLRAYKGVYESLKSFQPDVIFLHDVQFYDVFSVIRYVKEKPNVKVYADSHTDYINSARGWVSKNILHGIVYRWYAKKIEPYVKVFWATLPARAVFMQEMYRIPRAKIKLLELGADIEPDTLKDKLNIKTKIRQSLGVSENEFLVIAGGKIDKRKNIHLLVEAMDKLKKTSIKLIVFGTPDEEMHYLINILKSHSSIIYLGWQNQEQINELLLSADLGVFPGTHSTLWEQSCGLGLPCVFKKWENIQHVDIGGNCIFLNPVTPETIANEIYKIYSEKDFYKSMRCVAELKGIKHFSYDTIAKRAIEQEN